MNNDHESVIPPWCNYICIEGVIGVGKTTFSTMLANECSGRLVLEEAEENPFLEKFYRDKKSYSFQTQLWFLVSRFKQLSGQIPQQDLFHTVTVSDYMFAKDRIFATLNLEDEELALYEQVANVMVKSIQPPDLVVYLQASTDVLLKRIEKRGRSFEFNMDPRYISMLNEAYNHYFFHYNETPLLIVNTTELDFVNKPADYRELLQQIGQMDKGVNFYQPMPARDKTRLEDRTRSQKDQ